VNVQMSGRSRMRIVALAALLVSGGAHALVFSGLALPAAPEAGGGGDGGTEIALLGNDFADLAVGQAVPVAPTPQAPISAEAGAPVPPETLAPVAPPVAAPVVPVEAEITPLVTPETSLAVAAQAPAATPRPTPRPEVSPDKPASKTLPKPPKPAVKAATRPPVATGNADRQGVRGAADGVASGTGTRAQGTPGGASSAKALSPARYGAAVIKRIRATPRHGAAGRGTALVGFEIGPAGTLASVRILRSSGSAGLDQAALDHIRRSAPFPPPPATPARFSFEFVSKG